MRYPHGSDRIAGVLIPLAALRTEHNLGVGEYADLPTLAQWCRQVGFRLIQLLPVNDSGDESSPYSTLSASALHPIYLRIRELPEMTGSPRVGRWETALADIKRKFDGPHRFDYHEILESKIALLREIFVANKDRIMGDDRLTVFLSDNPWVVAYAVFRALKDRYDGKRWTDWPEHRDPTARSVEKLWNDPDLSDLTRFYTWLQVRAAEQFEAAAKAVADCGVALKGDIPILMNEDSADVWFDREIFDRTLNAGAPPDMFSNDGQNWRFPIYDWSRLRADDYGWWRRRLREAARYYHAYRIDHVLGFFRIWAIPAADDSGITGFFRPQHGFGSDDLKAIGFDEGRIRWLAEPHIPGDELRGRFDDKELSALWHAIPGEDLYRFRPDIAGEASISTVLADGDSRRWAIDAWRDRALATLPGGRYAYTWNFRHCSRYQTLNDDEKGRFEDLVARYALMDNDMWANHGRELLTVMRDTTEMLACAEDLGVIPEAVPRVLEELGILGLRISRWAHEWDQPGQPLIRVEDYPELTVSAPSVHDTSTLRDWWENEDGREELWRIVGGAGDAPVRYDRSVAEAVLSYFIRARSRIVVFQIQDLLALNPAFLAVDPHSERVNVPGTYNSFNWTWRLPVTMGELSGNEALSQSIKAVLSTGGRGEKSE